MPFISRTHIITTKKMEATVFNQAQLYLLRMMSLVKTDETMNGLKTVIARYFAKYIVSNDKHFNVLKYIPFPHVDALNIDESLQLDTM